MTAKRIAAAILTALGLLGAAAGTATAASAGVSATHFYGAQPDTHFYG